MRLQLFGSLPHGCEHGESIRRLNAIFSNLIWEASSTSTLSPEDLIAFFDSGGPAKAFLEQRADHRYCMQASAAPAQLAGVRMAPSAMARSHSHSSHFARQRQTLTDPTIRGGAVLCILHGFAILAEWQGKGLGHALFTRVHAYAFQMAQIVAMQQRLPTTVPLFEFRVHEGCCFRSPRALAVYQANCATITYHRQDSVGD